MSNDSPPTLNGQSPFDAGRTPCPQGGEDRWSARWLMEQMGYPTWQHFEPVVERAKTAAANQGFNVRTLFTVNREKSGGRPKVDYSVSRFAAYLIAMNGDPRKPEVAAAQAYFAVKTREAETANLDHQIPRTLPDALRAYAREVEAREAAESYVRELEPKAEYVDQFVSPDDCLLFRTVANQLNVQEKMLRELLVERRWIYREFIGRRYSKKAGELVDEYEWRAYADKKNYFRLFSQHNAPRHHNNQLRQTLYITPPGEQAIRKLVGREVVAA